ncbi:MAG: acyltransferase [Firmicutes bacterium]|nr:acyltransferase [Bacillota bacterium]
MRRRLTEFDLIRAGTALAVIAIHVTAGYMDLGLGYYWNHLVRFAVPLFIVMSGLVLYWRDLDDAVIPTGIFYRQRLRKIVVPYFIWTLLYSILNAYLLHQHDLLVFLNTLGPSLLRGSAYYHLYFLIIILQMYVLYPLLRGWIERYPRSLLGGSLLLTGFIQVLLYLYLLHRITLPAQYSDLYLLAFPVWLFYFVFGMFAAARLADKSEYREGFAHTAVLGLVWLASLALMLIDSSLSGIYVSILRPSVILYTLASFYFFFALASTWRLRDQAWVGWLSNQSFLIYLMHPLVLTLLIITARKLGHPALWSGNLGLVVFYISVTIITLAGTYLISLTPLSALLGGVSRSMKSVLTTTSKYK